MCLLHVFSCDAFSQADEEFVDMLASIRSGRCNPQGSLVEQLQGRCGQALDTSDGILPTKVCLVALVAFTAPALQNSSLDPLPLGCNLVSHVSACWLIGLGFRHT